MELANGKVNKFFTPKGKGENRYFVESFDAEKSKGQNNVLILTDEIPENSVVLDIGCAQGKFGPPLKKKNCTVYGIDIDPSAAECAEKSGNYRKVFLMDITKTDTEEYKDFCGSLKQVDAIIFSNIFEHLVDSTSVLCRFSKLLKDGGIVLVSVPNIAHMDIILNLMNGKFNYTNTGILDNTHLKFFTKSSFADWINQINHTFENIKFDCNYIGATFYESEYLQKVRKAYPGLYSLLAQYENYNGLELLFVLTKIAPESESVGLSALLKQEGGVDVVDLLGDAVKNKVDRPLFVKPIEGEKLWYENQFAELNNQLEKTHDEAQKYCKDKENEIGRQKKYIDQIKKILVRKNHYINQTNEEWRQQHSEMDAYAKKLETDIQEKSKYILTLEAKLQEMQKFQAETAAEFDGEKEALKTQLEDQIKIAQISSKEKEALKTQLEEKIEQIAKFENSFLGKLHKKIRK